MNTEQQIETSTADALKKIAEINQERIKEGNKHPLVDKFHPDHSKRKEEYAQLFKTAYPGKNVNEAGMSVIL